MIRTKRELKEWISVEVPYCGLKYAIFPQPQMTFVRMLRNFEYHYNNRHSVFHKLMLVYYYYKYYKASIRGVFLYPRILAEKDLHYIIMVA